LSLRLDVEAVRGVCDRLREVEKFVREHERDIPAASMALMHIVRAMELVGLARSTGTVASNRQSSRDGMSLRGGPLRGV
jgi:hypothetical protein